MVACFNMKTFVGIISLLILTSCSSDKEAILSKCLLDAERAVPKSDFDWRLNRLNQTWLCMRAAGYESYGDGARCKKTIESLGIQNISQREECYRPVGWLARGWDRLMEKFR